MYARRRTIDTRFFRGRELFHVLTMVFLLVALGSAYYYVRDPHSWLWLVRDPAVMENNAPSSGPEPAGVSPVSQSESKKPDEAVGAENASDVGTDLDPEEQQAIAKYFEAVTDNEPLNFEDMGAYWRLMQWSDNQTFAAMRRRAVRNVFYTQLWEEPEKYRGKIIELRLHVKQVLQWKDVPKNPAGIKTVFEARGWTDESNSLPYIVVFNELPSGFPLGTNLYETGTFVGYFLKKNGGISMPSASPVRRRFSSENWSGSPIPRARRWRKTKEIGFGRRSGAV